MVRNPVGAVRQGFFLARGGSTHCWRDTGTPSPAAVTTPESSSTSRPILAGSRPCTESFKVTTNNLSEEKDGTEDAFWTKIGAVFAHKDGKGYDVVLDCLPLDGRISIREPKERPTPQ